jgi:transcriptional regulator with XRE-family HTH domain
MMNEARTAPWTTAEDDVIRTRYPDGGVAAAQAELHNRSSRAVQCRASRLRVAREGVGGAASNADPDIGKAMRAWRTEHGVTQTRAAKLFGISQAMVAQIENGKKRPGRYSSKQIERVMAGPLSAAVEPAVLEATPEPASDAPDDASLLAGALSALEAER